MQEDTKPFTGAIERLLQSADEVKLDLVANTIEVECANAATHHLRLQVPLGLSDRIPRQLLLRASSVRVDEIALTKYAARHLPASTMDTGAPEGPPLRKRGKNPGDGTIDDTLALERMHGLVTSGSSVRKAAAQAAKELELPTYGDPTERLRKKYSKYAARRAG